MCAIFWIYQIGKGSSIKHSKTRNTTKKLKKCMRPWIRSYQLFLDFCPRRAFLAAPGSSWQLLAAPGSPWQPLAAPGRSWQLLAAPGSSWQLLAATKPIFSTIFSPGGSKIVITRRSGQLQSSYFACADLWTCWIRFWYSRSPKLTKMICFWPFSFYFFSYFSFLFNLWVGGMRL